MFNEDASKCGVPFNIIKLSSMNIFLYGIGVEEFSFNLNNEKEFFLQNS